MNSSLRLLLGGFLLTVPLSSLLLGCSGGSTPFTPSPTAGPTVTASPIPTTATGSRTTDFTLGNGQRVILKTTQNGTALTGTMQILAAATGTRRPQALTTTIQVGTFQISGTFTPPRGFDITVRDGSTSLLTLTGNFPTATQAGNYNLTLSNGQTDLGTLAALGTPTTTATPVTTVTPVTTSTPVATATPVQTATPTPGPTASPGISRLQSITITPGANFNGVGVGASKSVSGATLNFSNASSFAAPSNQLGGDNNFFFEGPILSRPARVGDTFTLQNRSAAAGILYYSEATGSGPARNWESTGGTLRVTAASATSVSFTLQNVTFAPQSFGTTSAKGTFTLSASGVFSG